MKKPEIFKNKNIEAIDHNTKYCYLKEEKDNTVKDILDEIFNGIGYSYNKKVTIETNDKSITTYLVARSKNSVMRRFHQVNQSGYCYNMRTYCFQ